ncbi:MAG: DUF3108 domain-containing protein [Gammaproteobacteria bacterium]|nr:DUF3108 domain-containing protein [Rhodocyclaceae bacterium]MBU3907616.1 DUF3108 domain-containing protein [Gammaproteobacteria bacterium]MBU3990896.1 DUF3108 domain-containing protein [Gammaproteobacteria bacterium]MBU4004262.1 DUF3108 domain-containing protein [Gammaproteobacteria bacterium]MBU4019671.1 DUF3108 domain-containing protein [Gammaproteobacteria bacterium]
MNVAVRRPFLLALVFSLMLHLLALLVPGWGLPADEITDLKSLDATLLPLAQAAVPATPPVAPARKPAPKKMPSVPPQTAEDPPASVATPVAESLAEAPEVTPPALPDEPQPDATAADAVPPAPTYDPAVARAWPQRGRIRFEVTRGESGFIVGQAEHRWQHDGATYQLRAVTETVGIAALLRPAMVVQESRGNLVATGLQPLEFRNERDGKRKLLLRFDPVQGRLTTDSGEAVAMSEPAQDLLSMLYQLSTMPHDAKEFAITVATGRKLTRHVVRVAETTQLATPFGSRSVLHLILPPADGVTNDDSTEVWLDIATRLPLKIRHRDRKGEIYDQTAIAVELENTQ